MTIIRHKLIEDALGHSVCNCGYDPFFLMDPKPLDWTDQTREVVVHIKKSRRWSYQGTEVHHGYKYHLWENELTGRKYAWEAETFRDQNTGVAA